MTFTVQRPILFIINVITTRLGEYKVALTGIVTTVTIFAMIGAFTCSAETIYHDYTDGKRLTINLSANQLNRIEFGKYGIAEIIGNEAEYQAITDQTANNLFITPKVGVGKKFTVSLIASSGQVQDLECVVKKIGAQTVIISSAAKTPASSVANTNNTDADEIVAMMECMQLHYNGKYYIQEHDKPIILKGENVAHLKAKQVRTYRYGDLTGVEIHISNPSKTSTYLSEADFGQIFNGTIATSISNSLIKPKHVVTVYLITKQPLDRDDSYKENHHA